MLKPQAQRDSGTGQQPQIARTQTGLTLIELLVTLCMIGILSSFATLSFTHWMSLLRVESDYRALISMVNAARQSAVRLNRKVTLCPGDDSGCGRRNTWHDGIIIFADSNNNRRLDNEETLLAHLPELHSTVTWRSFRNRSYLRFLPNGFTDWQNGHFQICPSEPDPALNRMLVLNYSGRLYLSNDTDQDGVHEDASGEALVC